MTGTLDLVVPGPSGLDMAGNDH